ncbi:TonB-dependent receptor [Gallaecimonas kandeliae]|uniref:TonB-dependent receptor n=1 Tax=Gallaecimonas kandeliae TaxID=3029055 RepID=UPI0026488E82|nr:TonB-dependent receptor [Gallaecimonas kandeliae]WKE67088.1 TonB-dependent receptor [Gallaecimonas kandeliae]
MSTAAKNARWAPGKLALAVCLGLAATAQAAEEKAAKAKDDPSLEVIEVTARRTVENLQTVPVAVTSLSAEQMSQRGVEDLADVQWYSPNTTLQVSRGTNSTLTAYIRGIGQQDPLWGFEPGVGIYIDDVYVARPQGAVMDILDVQRIEVLRGPQGTLYGRNTIGGAVKYVTKKLSGDPEFNVQGTLGSYKQHDLKLSGQMPLSDNFYAGFAFGTFNRDGFGKFKNTGADNYNKDIKAGRLSLAWYPSEALSVQFMADRTWDDSNAKGGYRLTPSLITGQQPYDSVYDSDTSMPTDNSVETGGEALTLSYGINSDWTFKSITAHRDGDTDTNIDFDSTKEPALDIPALYHDRQFTQEFQLNVNSGDWQGVGGLYYLDGKACGVFETVLGLAGMTLENGGCVNTKSYAAYAQGSYHLSPKLSMTLGGRYTQDKKDANVYRLLYLGIRYPHDAPATPLLVQSDFQDSATFHRFSPRAGLEYQLSDDIMVYGSYTNGFKSGGFDMRANKSVNPDADKPYDPEIVDTYELGLKAEWLDRRLRTNIATFYSDYKDMQITVQRAVNNNTDVASQVLNAGKSSIKGVELEATLAATDALQLNANLGYVDAKFKRVDFFDPNQGRVIDVSDQWRFANTPKWTGSLLAQYNLAAFGGDLVLTGGLSYRSKVQIFETPSMLDTGSVTLLNAGASWYKGNWEVQLMGRNLTDREYRLAGYNFAAPRDGSGNITGPGLGGEDTIVGYYGDPRTVSLSVGYRF